MATTHLPARDVSVIFSATDIAAGTAIDRIQSATHSVGQSKEDVKELGTTDYYTHYNEPSIESTIERNCIGDSAIQLALNPSYVAGTSTLADLVLGSTGELITKNIYMVGGDPTSGADDASEIIFGIKNASLSSVDFLFSVGDVARESWRFEGSDLTDGTDSDDATAFADPGTPSIVTAMNPASGYGGVRHSDIDVQLMTSGGDAITDRVQSVSFSASVTRTPYSELKSITNGGVIGPYARVETLPFDVSCSIELMPSTNLNQITAKLGSLRSPTLASGSTAVVIVTLTDITGSKVYKMEKVVMDQMSMSAQAGDVGTISFSVTGVDLYL